MNHFDANHKHRSTPPPARGLNRVSVVLDCILRRYEIDPNEFEKLESEEPNANDFSQETITDHVR